MTEITKEEIERANEFLVDVRGYCNVNHEAWIRGVVRELTLYAAHVTAEKDKEIEWLRAQVTKVDEVARTVIRAVVQEGNNSSLGRGLSEREVNEVVEAAVTTIMAALNGEKADG